MRYILLLYMNENEKDFSPETMNKWKRFREEVGDKYLSDGVLNNSQLSKIVQLKNGAVLTTDGPFIETKEQLVGYVIIESSGMEEALKIAERCPILVHGKVEIRPFFE